MPDIAPNAQSNDQPSTSTGAGPATAVENDNQPRSRDVESSPKPRPLSVTFEDWATDVFVDPHASNDN